MEDKSSKNGIGDLLGKYYLTISYVIGVIWYWFQGWDVLYAMANAYAAFIFLHIAQLAVMTYTYIVERRVYWWRKPGMVVFVFVMYILAHIGGQGTD